MVAKQPQNSEIFASSENGNQNTSNQQQSRVSSGTKLGSVAYGMLRKTKNKTYSALRGGSSKTSSDIIEEDEGFEMEYSHQAVGTDDLGAAPSHSTPLGSNRNGIDTVLRSRGSLGDRSLYFSPQNSWRDVGRTSSFGIGHGRTNVPLPPSFENDHSNGSTEELVRNVERTLRYVVVCCVFFMAGTLMPERAPIVSKALELSLVAWGTCLVIVGLTWFQRYKSLIDERIIQQTIIVQPNEAITPPGKSKTSPSTVTNTEPFKPPKVERKINIANLDDEVEASLEPSSQCIQKRSYDEIAIVDSSLALSAPKVMRDSTAPSRVIPKQHAHLEDLYIMMVEKDKRIYPNGGATKIDNKLFSGEMLLMFRTPDADEPVSDVPEKDPIANYFRGKQRRFEFQWQFKLKKVPKGDVFMCCELDEPIRMGMIQRTLVNTVLKFVKKTNQGFSYFISDSVENPSYLSFPVGTSMDRFMATKPGENIPKLGNEVVEDPDIAKKRKKGMQIEWNTEDVYTMALWSAYFDWIDWQILNFPGIRPFSATSVAGVQPIKLTLYSVSDSGNGDVSSEIITSHEKLLAMEISNSSKSCLGNEAKKWKTKSLVNERVMDFVEEGASKEETTNVVESDDASPIICDDSINEEEDDEIDDNSDDEEEPMYYDVAEIEESLDNFDGSNYLLSGIPILLREGTGNFVASGGGYAVLQSSQSSSIVLEKTFGSKKTFSINHKSGLPSLPSMIIRSGDIVRVKLIQQADRNTAKIVKYLSIHRGWWLKWTSTRPKRNGSFYIRTNGSNGEFMPLGHPFSLASRRWSHYLVGACVESSIKFGGRMLGIYKNGKSSMADEPDSGEDDYDPMIENEPDGAEKSNNNRMMPLLLCAEAIHSSEVNFDSSPPKSPTRKSRPKGEHLLSEDVTSSAPGDTVVELLEKRYALDAPAWIEMMNRTKRTKQLVYVIRVEETMLKQNSEATQSEPRDVTQTDNSFSHESHPGNAEANNTKHHDNSFVSNTYVKLRTGHDLAPVLRLGLECNKERSHTDRMLQISDMDDDEEEGRSEQRFDFSDQIALQRADSFSSSSDDSESDDEALDFLIAGPNHSDAQETLVTEPVDDSYAKVWPDEQLVETYDIRDDDGDIESPNTGEMPIDKSSMCELPPELPALSPSVSSAGGRKNMLDESIHSTKSAKKGIGFRRRKSTDQAPDMSPLDVTNNEDPNLALTKSERHFAKQASLLDSDDSNKHITKYDDDMPKVHFESVESIESKKKKTKHAAVLGRVAKTIKASTVIKHGKKVGKGTVNAGKAVGKGTVIAGKAAGRVIPVSSVVYSYKPPTKHEPGTSITRPNRSQKNHKISLRTVNKALKNIKGQSTQSAALPLPPEESCRKISDIVSALSTNEHAISLLVQNNSLDLAFLRGSSAEIGVVPIKPVDKKIDDECIIARNIWDGHWREELCAMYTQDHHLAFYAPLTKKPSLVLCFEEIVAVRKCDPTKGASPLPGFHLLSIDTAWRCHYIAFREDSEREVFFAKINDAYFHMPGKVTAKSRHAQEWESFQMSLETSLTGLGVRGKWALVSTGKKSKQKKQRRILNGRRMSFDIDSITKTANNGEIKSNNAQEEIATYVENLLKIALSFSPDALESTQSRFMEFLDEASRLRSLPLHEIDLFSEEAFCIFVNLYHCLLQHALLLAVDGLPDKRSVTPFKRCSCYEIGGDVFSLSELEYYVIRGKTSRASHPKPPFVEGAKKSRAFEQYALGVSDHRINFILNNGDLAYPSSVPVLQRQTMEDQIEACSSHFLKSQVKIDKRKRTVFLPKVCDVYRNDFGMGDGLMCLSQCLKYLSDTDQLTIVALLNDGVGSITVKFRPPNEQFHTNLTLLC